MDELNQAEQERVSAMVQVEHLSSEIQQLYESLMIMNDKLAPLLPPSCPALTGGDCAKPRQESPLMDALIGLTAKVIEMNSGVCHVVNDIQI